MRKAQHRIPRKLKKKYKKLWENSRAEKLIIRRESISKGYSSCTRLDIGERPEDPRFYKKVWGCEVYPKNQ